jgi:hypothetical protein
MPQQAVLGRVGKRCPPCCGAIQEDGRGAFLPLFKQRYSPLGRFFTTLAQPYFSFASSISTL